MRSFFFAQLLAAREGCLADTDYDRDLVFAATVMHDLGAGGRAPGEARFEVEGADLAVGVLRQHGVAESDVGRVWEAIALHTSPGIAERRGLLCYLTREGVGVDFGRNAEVAAAWAGQIHAAYPRLGMARAVTDAIVAHAARSAAAAPPYSLAGELARERRDDGVTGWNSPPRLPPGASDAANAGIRSSGRGGAGRPRHQCHPGQCGEPAWGHAATRRS